MKIILAGGDLIRRHGANKTNVLDIARYLGVSHTHVYRHFGSKAEILDAVADHWLQQISDRLVPVADRDDPAEQRLGEWLHELSRIMAALVKDDPELFGTFDDLVEASRAVIGKHVARLESQLKAIINDGVLRGEFRVADSALAAKAVLDGTIRFHHPLFVTRPSLNNDNLDNVLNLLLQGLKAGPPASDDPEAS